MMIANSLQSSRSFHGQDVLLAASKAGKKIYQVDSTSHRHRCLHSARADNQSNPIHPTIKHSINPSIQCNQ